jgi:hypothetical protein
VTSRYWRDVVERVLTTAGYTGIVAMLGDLVGAVNVSLGEAGGASVGGALLAFLGSLLARKVGDPQTAAFDGPPGKHARPES